MKMFFYIFSASEKDSMSCGGGVQSPWGGP